MSGTLYQFRAVRQADGSLADLACLQGKVVLIVNTASKCKFSQQLRELQTLYDTYHARGLEILAFPCNQFLREEPRSGAELCSLYHDNWGVSFPIMAKIKVNGKEAHPIYKFLKSNVHGFGVGSTSGMIKWNYTKFLVGRDGRPTKRFAPHSNPKKMARSIEKLLDERTSVSSLPAGPVGMNTLSSGSAIPSSMAPTPGSYY